MRITSQMMTSRVLSDLQASQTRLASLQSQVSTGRKISQASDDPLGTANALRQRTDMAGIARDQQSVSEAGDWVSATDSALSQVTDVMHRVKELTVQGANGATTSAGRAAIAAEIGQLIESVKNSANAKVGDSYIFGGTATTAPPYTAGATDTYAGDNGTVARSIGPGVSVPVNTTGAQVFGSGGGDGKLLDTLRNIQAHLSANNVNALGTTDLQALDANLDAVTAVQAGVGATQNRLDAAASRLTDAATTAAKVNDSTESADLAESLMHLSAQSSAYQAALKSASSIMQPSLLDFLH
jgi:flagellar hook-associated protein 3 FlgL